MLRSKLEDSVHELFTWSDGRLLLVVGELFRAGPLCLLPARPLDRPEPVDIPETSPKAGSSLPRSLELGPGGRQGTRPGAVVSGGANKA